MTSPIVNVGIVCFGMSGRVFHAPFLITNPHYRLLSVFERSKSEAEAFLSFHKYSHPVKTVRSVQELVEDAAIDLVVVCSPIELHYEHAMLALKFRKHVLVEKAFCSNATQATHLVEFARASNLICVPFQNRRFDADFRTLQRVVKSEKLIGDIVEYNGFYNRWKPTANIACWKDRDPSSGGNFLSLGSHMIDQVVSLFGAPSRVWADLRCQRPGGILNDAWEVHLFYEEEHKLHQLDEEEVEDKPVERGVRRGGLKVVVKGSLLARDSFDRYLIHGKKGSWRKGGLDTQESSLIAGNLPTYPVEYGPSESASAATAAVSSSSVSLTASASVFPTASDSGSSTRYGVEPKNQWGVFTDSDGMQHATPSEAGSYHLLYDSLYEAIVHKAAPFMSGDEAVTVMRIIDLAHESSELGQVLRLL